jgi:nitrile hydratase alpha subunit
MEDHDHWHQTVPSDITLRVKALESLLVEKGLVDPAALDALIDTYEHKVGPRNGGRVVARAWVDPAYKKRLLTDATAAIAELGYGGRGGEHMVVVENTPKLHKPCRLHVVLLLSLAGLRSATGLVQVGALSLACGDRPARCSARIRARAARGCRSARLGQHC